TRPRRRKGRPYAFAYPVVPQGRRVRRIRAAEQAGLHQGVQQGCLEAHRRQGPPPTVITADCPHAMPTFLCRKCSELHDVPPSKGEKKEHHDRAATEATLPPCG